VTGAISAANSLVGSSTSDQIGLGGVTALANGNYVARSASWNQGALDDVGAVTWGSGTTGVSGAVSAGNSMIGTIANTNLLPVVVDNVNGTFIGPFVAEVGGRVRVSSQLGGVVGVEPSVLSENLSLARPSPNPFRTETTLRFRAPSGSGRATLELFDLTGARARVLFDGVPSGGEVAVRWDGRSDAGAPCTAGIYFARLRLGATHLTTMLVRLK
jgi:hypothetical protein